MGYSIAAPIRSRKAQAKMLAFLEKHYRPWLKIAEGTDVSVEPGYDNSHYFLTESDLSYDHGKLRIGFDYSSWMGHERHYIYSVLRWIAIKVGRQRLLNDTVAFYGENTPRVPYIVYDGYEAWPVLVNWSEEDCKKMGETPVNEVGFKPCLRNWTGHHLSTEQSAELYAIALRLGWPKECDKIDELVHAELKRLNTLWAQEEEKHEDNSCSAEAT